MKIQLELNVVDGIGTFLNYWDALHGKDVVCLLKDGKLLEQIYGEEEDDLTEKEISFADFCSKVITQVKEDYGNPSDL